MILYIVYRIAYFIAMTFPLKVSYAVGCALADLWYYVSTRDRTAVRRNLRVIMGEGAGHDTLKIMTRDVFRNFAKYLVDFFRFSKVDAEYVRKFVKIEGLENVDMALAGGKGVILLSAHFGNWELGGLVMSLIRQPMGAVVLTHKNERINNFFRSQRSIGNLKPIEIGMTLRGCYDLLRANGLLALLGDRDFSNNGLYIEFFGKKTAIPKGPAVFSCRLGSPIVSAFMIREKDDTFRLIFGQPIYPRAELRDDNKCLYEMAGKYSSIIESYVRKYPTQWYMFRDVWSNNEKNMRPDTVL